METFNNNADNHSCYLLRLEKITKKLIISSKVFLKLREELEIKREREYVVKVMTINHFEEIFLSYQHSLFLSFDLDFTPRNNELKSQFKPQY